MLICCDIDENLIYYSDTVYASGPVFDDTASVSGYSAQQTSEIDIYYETWASASLGGDSFLAYGMSVPFLVETLLAPGLHTLRVVAHSGEVSGSLPGTSSFSFTLTVLPEPSTGALLAAALAYTLARRPRNRRPARGWAAG